MLYHHWGLSYLSSSSSISVPLRTLYKRYWRRNLLDHLWWASTCSGTCNRLPQRLSQQTPTFCLLILRSPPKSAFFLILLVIFLALIFLILNKVLFYYLYYNKALIKTKKENKNSLLYDFHLLIIDLFLLTILRFCNDTGWLGCKIGLGLRDRSCPVPLQTTQCPIWQRVAEYTAREVKA